MAAAEISVSGRVQGIGYRYFAERAANALSITGWTMNTPDGGVALDVEGERGAIEKLILELKRGPRMAAVTGVNVMWKPYQGRHQNFFIRV